MAKYLRGENNIMSIKKAELLCLVTKDISKITASQKAVAINQIANRYFKYLPESDDELIMICEEYMASSDFCLFSLATRWLSKRQSIKTINNFYALEKMLFKYINEWWKCDQLCNRVINPIIERYPETFDNVINWTKSNKTYVRRAAAVSLIHSSRGFIVTYDLEKVLKIVEVLKGDCEEHVLKGVGWLLKAASVTYPDEVIQYLKKNVSSLPRIVFRYSLEKLPDTIRKEMMSIKY